VKPQTARTRGTLRSWPVNLRCDQSDRKGSLRGWQVSTWLCGDGSRFRANDHLSDDKTAAKMGHPDFR
jgi:hypothetical protein